MDQIKGYMKYMPSFSLTLIRVTREQQPINFLKRNICVKNKYNVYILRSV